jgi:hypothetical protein
MCPSRPEGLKHMMFMCDQAKSVWNYLGVWRHIEELANGDRTGQQMIEKVIKGGRKVPSLNNVGLVELILTGSGTYGGNGEVLFMRSQSRMPPDQLCRLQLYRLTA